MNYVNQFFMGLILGMGLITSAWVMQMLFKLSFCH
jgi:hypothetical protein